MTELPPRGSLSTHEVENQPGPHRYALWEDRVLREVLGPSSGVQRFAEVLSTSEMTLAAEGARDPGPRLRLFDVGGRRLDEVRFASGYHQLMTAGAEAGYAGGAWTGGRHLDHAAMVYLLTQVEPGVCCPLTMTYAAVPALQADAALSAIWTPRLTARAYDPAIRPVEQKAAATLGMAMTEKQGGSDVRSNTTRAERAGDHYVLNGHKWFCSAPMSDGFLTLAQTDGGLTCFLVPRWLEGSRNGIHLMRLKDKLGNRANASAEIEYHNAIAHRLGDEGRGVPTIIEMVHHTRLDTAMAPAGLMRAALVGAHHWVSHRSAFQRRLIDQPLMRAVLADLVLDWEGALRLGLHIAKAFDGSTPEHRAFARIGVALAKFLNNKLCPRVTYEAMECLGGMGYVEDTGLPMLYREAPLNGIWEGSGNVICLDILRTLAKDPLAAEMLHAELEAARGGDRRYDAALDEAVARWPGPVPEAEARWFAERMGFLLTASVLIREAPTAVADGFVLTRLQAERGTVAGSVAVLDEAVLLERLV